MFAEINGINLFYKIVGKGEPILLIHGNGQNHRAMKHILDDLALDHMVIAVDSRGHGKSDAGTTPLDFEIMALDMLSLLDYLKIDKYKVVGYSDGGIISLVMGKMQPNRQIASVVIGTNYHVNQIRFLPDLFCRIAYGAASIFAPFSRFFDRMKRQLALTIYHPHMSEADLEKISAPLLAIIGEFDMISSEDTQKMIHSVQRGKMEIINNGTHFLPRQNPKQLLQLIHTFFSNSSAQIHI
ncbi:alpha/beta hydrolase [Listeria sp. FSL L7-1485]|uniref:Alpha/beta hydrolase n=1 Tax=Listeria immobilis TaxID=2713502 RepID=A0A7X0X602_9LIST|nr:alpha/beta hydrolase [Listeria immobilis]MBC1482551.1 alpha/beta hydrolase [Listeria immobilis]MBC1488220.1 alpha/beta hydrolase [Listeria immobilis]MBC1507856.1 alpha/beta hydrolase [Listeria immobilis]MBC1509813.1 alpha/beta hydrolase [Listeria immobilis]MBC1516984.1 alpha/beta hydrolase [Listeria immobilis]